LLGSFGPIELSVPRARMAVKGGGTQEWRNASLPRYARMTKQVEALIAGAYLSGTNTRRVKRALAALLGDAVGKDVVSQMDAPWQTLVSRVARVSRLTYIKDTHTGLWATREEVGYYPCQIRYGAKVLGGAIRAHWGIENRAHYVRDATLGGVAQGSSRDSGCDPAA